MYTRSNLISQSNIINLSSMLEGVTHSVSSHRWFIYARHITEPENITEYHCWISLSQLHTTGIIQTLSSMSLVDVMVLHVFDINDLWPLFIGDTGAIWSRTSFVMVGLWPRRLSMASTVVQSSCSKFCMRLWKRKCMKLLKQTHAQVHIRCQINTCVYGADLSNIKLASISTVGMQKKMCIEIQPLEPLLHED